MMQVNRNTLARGPEEPVDEKLQSFYSRLLAVLRHPVVRDGQWQLLDVHLSGRETGPVFFPRFCLAVPTASGCW